MANAADQGGLEPVPGQAEAINAEGNVLVMAGAGTGKTHTLVERCLARILHPNKPASLHEILLVTFTEAAAGEVRLRVRQRIEQECLRLPGNQWLAEQAAMVDAACISTLHSFCLRLVREGFHELEIDPQVTVLDEAQALVLALETLDQLMAAHYVGATPRDERVRRLILAYGGGRDEAVRSLVLRTHNYAQTLPDPLEWLAEQQNRAREETPRLWLEWLIEAVADWRESWLECLTEQPHENANAADCASALRALAARPSRKDLGTCLRAILETDKQWPNKRKERFRAPIKELFEEAEFLSTLAEVREPAPDRGAVDETSERNDPLADDWALVRPHLAALVELATEYSARFARSKRELGVVDFHDLEQMALRLLWDRQNGCPTDTARRWRERFRFVFVDECQDINAAQDRIIEAVSRDGADANRFLVGDVKQSIYRFRLANPRIFQDYARRWKAAPRLGGVLHLARNFRSRRGILDFVNALFSGLMCIRAGGVDYDQEAWLQAARQERAPDPGQPVEPVVEFHLRLVSKEHLEDEDEAGESGGESRFADHTRIEKEALLVALRLQELKRQPLLIRDKETETPRPVEWRDMVVLLRSPRYKAEGYAKVFSQLGVPISAARRGLYQAIEVSDLLHLLMLLDNPLQDVPALAVLRSPLANMSLKELALIRIGQPKGTFWNAVRSLLDQDEFSSQAGDGPEDPEIAAARVSAQAKVSTFLDRFERWRRLARRGSLSRCLEAVIEETRYEDWLLAQPQGARRVANLQKFLALARRFDKFQRQGLFRFLKYVETQQETAFDPEPAILEGADAVRLMSIHQAKGLEFPVVVVADLGKAFNLDDTKGPVMLDDRHGLCPLAISQAGPSYPSLPYWLAARRQTAETLGEELRLLYVACTRARERLILAGTASRKRAEQRSESVTERLSASRVLAADSCLDWVGPLIGRLADSADWLERPSGQSELLTWRLYEGDDWLPSAPGVSVGGGRDDVVDLGLLAEARDRLAWTYSHESATRTAAKTSVSALRRRFVGEDQDEARRLFQPRLRTSQPGAALGATRKPGAAETGTATHRFLELVSVDRTGSRGEIERELDRIVSGRWLSPEEAALIDTAAVAAFWQSSLGGRARDNARWVQREVEFTARFSKAELVCLDPAFIEEFPPEEFMVVQGVVDLAVVRPDEVWLVDFKTDDVSANGAGERARFYKPQLNLYAFALGRILGRPVTGAWLHFLIPNRSIDVLAP